MTERRSPLSFGDHELAEPVDKPPLMFDRLRVPCECGGVLIGEEYAFFPNTLFIRGTCLKCGPRSAFFAPPVSESEKQRIERISAELTSFSRDLAVQYKQEEGAVIADFLEYLNERRTA